MQINNNQYNPSFKQIKLTTKEGRIVSNLYRQYKSGKSKTAMAEVVDIFTPHIEKEVESLKLSMLDAQDTKQNIFLKLIETFTFNRLNSHPSFNIVEILNKAIETEKHTKFPKKLSFDKLTQKERSSLIFENGLEMAKAETEYVANLIQKTSQLSEREKSILQDFRNDIPSYITAEEFKLTSSRIREIQKTCIHKIKMQHIPEYREQFPKSWWPPL